MRLIREDSEEAIYHALSARNAKNSIGNFLSEQ
jgi:hypothetical protein